MLNNFELLFSLTVITSKYTYLIYNFQSYQKYYFNITFGMALCRNKIIQVKKFHSIAIICNLQSCTKSLS